MTLYDQRKIRQAKDPLKSETGPVPKRRKRVRLFDPADLERISTYRPLPLNWKGPRGLLFKSFVKSSPENYYLKPDEVADFLGTSTSDLQSWRARGIGPSYTKNASGSIRYNIGGLLEYAERRRSRPLHK